VAFHAIPAPSAWCRRECSEGGCVGQRPELGSSTDADVRGWLVRSWPWPAFERITDAILLNPRRPAQRGISMTVLSKTVPIAVATGILLALCGCSTGAASSGDASTGQPAPAGSASPSQASPGAVTDSPAAAAGNAHPCSVVTEQEATTALGADPGPGQESPAGVSGLGTCVYGSMSSVVRVSVDSSGVGKAIYDGDRSTVTDANASSAVDVPGVGDAAFETPSGASQTTIYFYKGTTFVEITLGVPTGEPPKDQTTVLATSAAGRV
jgi:hypothetical protein